MSYRAPLDDIGFALKYGAALGPAIEQGLFGDLSLDDVEAVLAEAGRFAGEVIAPLNRIGDTFGAKFADGAVTTAPGWKEAYRDWRLAGWNAVTAPAQWGGQALPQIVNAACTEMWHAASVGFANGPMLTMAAIDALNAHGSDTLKRTYLEKLVSGEWMGTMQLTEPQAGSDVGALRTTAERAAGVEQKLRHQEQRDAARAGRRVGQPRQHEMDDVVGEVVLAVGDEDLAPRDPVGAVGIALSLGAQRADVGAGLRLGELHGAGPLAGDELGEIFLLERVSAVLGEGVDRRHGEHRADAECHRGGIPHLDAGGVDGMRQALASELGRRRQPIPAGRGPVAIGLFPARRRGDDAVLDGCPVGVADPVERCDHVGRELAGFFQDGVERLIVEVVDAGLARFGEPGGVPEREGDVGDRGAVGHRHLVAAAGLVLPRPRPGRAVGRLGFIVNNSGNTGNGRGAAGRLSLQPGTEYAWSFAASAVHGDVRRGCASDARAIRRRFRDSRPGAPRRIAFRQLTRLRRRAKNIMTGERIMDRDVPGVEGARGPRRTICPAATVPVWSGRFAHWGVAKW